MRPTADRVREAVFNILGSRTEGARVLDLFAGTGALGLEALSRGALSAGLAGAGVMEPGGTVVVEEAERTGELPFPPGWERFEDRRYGDTRVMIFTVEREPG